MASEARKRCDNPMPREAGSGSWQEWHRGHGCDLDPDMGREPSHLPTCATEYRGCDPKCEFQAWWDAYPERAGVCEHGGVGFTPMDPSRWCQECLHALESDLTKEDARAALYERVLAMWKRKRECNCAGPVGPGGEHEPHCGDPTPDDVVEFVIAETAALRAELARRAS